MVEFKKYKLGDLGDVCMCKRILKEETNNTAGIPFYKIGTFGNTADVYIDKQKYEEYKKLYSYPKKGDILISAAGTIGRTVVYDGSDAYFQDSNIVWIDNDESKVLNRYLFYCYKNIRWYTSTGSTILRLYNDNIRNSEIIAPDLPTQKKITDVLSCIDDKIALNNKTNAELENMAKTVYDYWFTQFDFPDKNGHPYKTSGGQMVYNELLKREIPVGWEVKKLSEVISSEKNAIVDGPFGTQLKIEEYVESGIPVYEMWMLNNCFIVDNPNHFITKEKFEDVKRSCVKNGDILISKTGTLGLLGLLETRDYEKGLIVSRLAKITPDCNKIGRYSLLIYLKEINDSGYWLQKSAGSTMPILNNELIGSLPVLWPNTNLYQIMESKISPLFYRIHELQLENKKLIEIRDYLLPLLMNGQIEIK